MSSLQWNTELISLFSMACLIAAIFAALVTFILRQRKLTALQQQLQDSALHNSRLAQQLIAAETSQHNIEQHLQQQQQQLQQERNTLNQLQQQLSEEGKKAKMFETSSLQAKDYITELKSQLEQQQSKFSQLQQQHLQLTKQHTELDTSLQQRERHFEQQLSQLAENKQILSKEFENLANKIFEEKGKTFTDTSKQSIDGMLKPFREQIEAFQKRVNEVHDSATRGSANLNAEIQKVLDIGINMSKEANNLTTALKGDSQQRGAWGEAQLQRTLEMSGLVQDAHFSVQTGFKDRDGKQKQTDFLVKLPDNKHIIIDSKVSLVAYDRAISADSNEAYQLAMAEHIKAVRRHIDDLASKDYTNLIGMHSPSFVLMFMPIEPAYIEALKHNKDLFEYGYKQNIVLVSHTTLIPILRTVSNLWMIERSNTEACEISERAAEVYNQVCLVAERLQKLGVTLNTVSNHYNSTVTALAGQQGLYGKVDRFSQLSAKVSKSLPQLETSHRDFESERLSMLIEPIAQSNEAGSNEVADKTNGIN
ncbi:DNA recombination protein RmuC [Rheinheimera sp. WS51]|uniref:DNA recombination protein RmuC n=1 Tax=Rheinheimera sp. WS51 TaxID=3425886 RepID=UPI003D94EC35